MLPLICTFDSSVNSFNNYSWCFLASSFFFSSARSSISASCFSFNSASSFSSCSTSFSCSVSASASCYFFLSFASSISLVNDCSSYCSAMSLLKIPCSVWCCCNLVALVYSKATAAINKDTTNDFIIYCL